MWDLLLDWLSQNQNSAAAQALATGGLVLFAGIQILVAWLARRDTKRLATTGVRQAAAAKEQAEASIKMAAEMREQRVFAAEPILAVTSAGSGRDYVTVRLSNNGRGPAYNIRFSIKHRAFEMPGKIGALPYLGVGESYEQNLHVDSGFLGAPTFASAPIEAHYEDQYGKAKFSSWQDGVLKTGWANGEAVSNHDS